MTVSFSASACSFSVTPAAGESWKASWEACPAAAALLEEQRQAEGGLGWGELALLLKEQAWPLHLLSPLKDWHCSFCWQGCSLLQLDVLLQLLGLGL